MKAKKKKSRKHIQVIGSLIGSCFIILFLGILVFFISYQHALHKQVILEKIAKPLPTDIPTPTIDISLQNTFKTYVSNLYGFTVTYPALGEDTTGDIITCGNNIEELLITNTSTKQKEVLFPTIRIDSLYQITLHPWGSQLVDYINNQDKNVLQSGRVVWVRYPNVDEAVQFYTNDTPDTGYFKNVFALYKKGNLIYQIEKSQQYNAGCHMLFNPQENNLTSYAKNASDIGQSITNQYRYWNEATSIQFVK